MLPLGHLRDHDPPPRPAMTNPPPLKPHPMYTPSPPPPAILLPLSDTTRARVTPYRSYYNALLTLSARAAMMPVLVGNACAKPVSAAPQVASPVSPEHTATPAIPGAQKTSWLVVGYYLRPPGASVWLGKTVDSWCKERIETITATMDRFSDSVAELRKVMEDLDCAKVADEIAVVGSIWKEIWNVRERHRKMVGELHSAEREGCRTENHAAHMDGKIARLRGYARCIERGWMEEPDINSCSRGKEGRERGSTRDSASLRAGRSPKTWPSPCYTIRKSLSCHTCHRRCLSAARLALV